MEREENGVISYDAEESWVSKELPALLRTLVLIRNFQLKQPEPQIGVRGSFPPSAIRLWIAETRRCPRRCPRPRRGDVRGDVRGRDEAMSEAETRRCPRRCPRRCSRRSDAAKAFGFMSLALGLGLCTSSFVRTDQKSSPRPNSETSYTPKTKPKTLT